MNRFKPNDFIFYYKTSNGATSTVPAIVKKVNRKTLRIDADFPDGSKETTVSKANCILQSDWLNEC